MTASLGKSRRSNFETLGEIGDSENSETHNFGTHEMTKSEMAQNPRFLSTQGSWVRAALDPLGFFVGVSLGKTLQSLA